MANTLHSTPATAMTTSPGVAPAMTEPQPDEGGAVAHKAQEAKQEAKSVVHDARREAQRTLTQTRQQLQVRADEQARGLASSLQDVGRQLHTMAEGGAPATGMVGDVVRQLADGVSSAANRLESGGLQTSMDDLRRFARRRPAMFLAGALGAGMLVGRMLRASDLHAIAGGAKGDTGGQDMSGGPAGSPGLGTGFTGSAYGDIPAIGYEDASSAGALGTEYGPTEYGSGYGTTTTPVTAPEVLP